MIKRRHSLIDNPIAEQDSQPPKDKPEGSTDAVDEIKADDARLLAAPVPVPNKLRRGVPFGR